MRRWSPSVLFCGSCTLISLFYFFFYMSDKLGPLVIYTANICPRNVQNCDGDTQWVSLDELMIGSLPQNDTRILNYIRRNQYLQPPSPLEYNLTSPYEDPSVGQSTIVKHALNNMRRGFFVECGGLDGETRSNTLMLERDYDWSGLLIEGDPKNYEKLLQKHRKAWTSPSCLATEPFPHQVMFKQETNTGRISTRAIAEEKDGETEGFVKVQCFPFYSLVSALNVTTIDYFSLDVEGSEIEVLKTIPFDSIFIKVLSVEYVHDIGGREAVRKLVVSKGFRVFGEVKDRIGNLANDLIFVNKRYQRNSDSTSPNN